MLNYETIKSNCKKCIYVGKVRYVYDYGENIIAFEHTNNQSAFDRHICEIPGKGIILTKCSEWWFNQTKHIIPNHFLFSVKNFMVCKRCIPFKIEVIVRGYITGSTSTSLWTHYDKGERVYCGIEFPDGLVKNQKLDYTIITPTTKGEKDELISEEDIINRGLANEKEWNYIRTKALELFEYGQKISDEKGLILVDTKYEFGKDTEGNILLIDEIHTCDSSRFWLKDTYHKKFEQGLEPDRFDKDIIRNYLSNKCDPYNDRYLPGIPKDLINQVKDTYQRFYKMLMKEKKN